ncbi:MAG: zinc-binding dehydrogenase [Clostridia bacterium]|nr:zinc-binding dehydrogenase [Clostridia bacterium]
MKAIYQAEPCKLGMNENFPDPVKDGKRPILKVEYCGICGSDVHSWEKQEGELIKGLVLGHEFSGKIVDPGDRADLKVGDRVTCVPITPCGECEWCKSGRTFMCGNNLYSPGIFFPDKPGALAEYFQPLKGEYIKKVPDNVPLDVAAMVEPAGIGLRGCQAIDVGPGDKVLVAGGGIIGSMCANWAKVLGADYVAMTELNKARAQKALEMGVVDDVFDPTEEGVEEKINAKIDGGYRAGGGFTKFIDCTGAAAAINFGMNLTKKAGKVSLVGVNWKPVPLMTIVALLHQLTLVGIMSSPTENFDIILKAVSEGKFNLAPYKTKEIGFTLDEIQAAYEELHDPTNEQLKIMVKIGEGE